MAGQAEDERDVPSLVAHQPFSPGFLAYRLYLRRIDFSRVPPRNCILCPSYLTGNTTLISNSLENIVNMLEFGFVLAPCFRALPPMAARLEVLPTPSESPYPSRLLSYKQITPFAQPLLSYTYALQNSQVLCFDIHTNCPGCVHESVWQLGLDTTPILPQRRSAGWRIFWSTTRSKLTCCHQR